MDRKIITKFTVATEQGMYALLMLTSKIATQKFTGLLDKQVLEKYIAANFSKEKLVVEVNSMSNQWLVVYVDDEPAGYARITSKGKIPETLDNKRVIRIADFGILNKYKDAAVIQSLFDKCIMVCKPYEKLWINEYVENPLLDFFETAGFVRQEMKGQLDELPLSSVCLIR